MPLGQGHLQLLHEVGEEEEELGLGQGLAHALALSQAKRDQVLVVHNAGAIRGEEALGLELPRVGKVVGVVVELPHVVEHVCA